MVKLSKKHHKTCTSIFANEIMYVQFVPCVWSTLHWKDTSQHLLPSRPGTQGYQKGMHLGMKGNHTHRGYQIGMHWGIKGNHIHPGYKKGMHWVITQYMYVQKQPIKHIKERPLSWHWQKNRFHPFHSNRFSQTYCCNKYGIIHFVL